MNCANHPERPATAYCQFCGKPLCGECVHKINGIVGCEPCLAARIGTAAPAGGAPFSQDPGYQRGYAAEPVLAGSAARGANPGIALAVGWIPGVGAVYNGQIAKALIHVAVFALLVDFTHYNGLIGLLIPIWVLYQMWDAYETAIARRDGLPLPNPLGLNDAARWFGTRTPVPPPGGPGWNSGTGPVSAGAAAVPPVTPGAGYPAGAYIPPVPPNQYDTPDLCAARGMGIPTAAVVLIVLGVGFLLANMGVLSEDWIDRGWPILLIGLGVWLVIRRSQIPPRSGGPR